MIAILLAGGKGTRLLPLTKTTPKCLIDIAGKPCIVRVMEHLKSHGVDKFIINLHHLPSMVIKTLSKYPFDILYLYEPELLGFEGTIKKLKPWVNNQPFVVANADTITNVDIKTMIKRRQEDVLGKITYFDIDGKTQAGTWVFGPDYLTSPDRFTDTYNEPNSFWLDIGTPENLIKARKFYES